MREHPILFSAPMVRALLDGTKTQTRRALRVQPLDVLPMTGEKLGKEWVGLMSRDPEPKGTVFHCKYGEPGDRLWVKETGWERPVRTQKMMREGADTWEPYYFDADGISEADHEQFKEWGFKRRPSIFMPRKASRILLEVTGVRVERLQSCSESDARAEGVTIEEHHKNGYCAGEYLPPSIRAYREIWGQINGPASWATNPWVWVIEFKKVAGEAK